MELKGVEIGILVRTRLKSRDCGRLFLEILAGDASHLRPDFFGHFEPVKNPFSVNDISGVLTAWGKGFLWRRTQPRISGQVIHGPVSAHDAIYLSLRSSEFHVSFVYSFVARLEGAFGIEMAYVHGRRAADSDNRREYARSWMPFAQGLTTHHLREGIPDFPWLLLFGPAYVGLFGRDRLLRVPAAAVDSVGDCIAVRLTNSMSDCGASRAEYERARDRAKEYLDKNAFRCPGQPSETPTFVFDQS
jgi:hypothetical protein